MRTTHLGSWLLRLSRRERGVSNGFCSQTGCSTIWTQTWVLCFELWGISINFHSAKLPSVGWWLEMRFIQTHLLVVIKQRANPSVGCELIIIPYPLLVLWGFLFTKPGHGNSPTSSPGYTWNQSDCESIPLSIVKKNAKKMRFFGIGFHIVITLVIFLLLFSCCITKMHSQDVKQDVKLVK